MSCLLLLLGTALGAAEHALVVHAECEGRTCPVEDGRAIGLSSPGTIRFAISGPVEDDRRIRYRLDGVDRQWNDPPSFMRVIILFNDEKNEVVGSCDFNSSGETPGWRQAPELSPFVKRRESIIVPSHAKTAKISFLSHGEELAVGVLGIDHVVATVVHPGDAEPTRYALDCTPGEALDKPLGSPANWHRSLGTRAEIAQLRTRRDPAPHPILTLDDQDPHRYGNWTNRAQKVVVAEGEEFILEWETAHSIGRSGSYVAEYRDLPSGSYALHVVLAKADGSPIDGTMTSIPLTVTVPLRHRWFFWPSTVLLAAAAGIWVGRSYVRRRLLRRLELLERQQAMERERERIARDLHDNIGAGLTEIAMLSDGNWGHGDAGEADAGELEGRVERIRQSATELARSVDEIVWAINPNNDNLPHFANYLVQATSQFFSHTSTGVRYRIPQDLPDHHLSGRIRHNLFLVVREATNNIAKYANAAFVCIELECVATTIHLTVMDDGRGFSLDQAGPAGTHEGLDNMQKRMKDIGGRFQITSSPGSGTRIDLWVQLTPLPSGAQA